MQRHRKAERYGDEPADDPFVRGPFTVGARTLAAADAARNVTLPCEVWYPAARRHAGQDFAPATMDSYAAPPQGALRSQMAVRDADARAGTWPLIVFSHPSASHRRAATYLCTHLSSHGYVVAALDHSENVAPGLARSSSETPAQRAARVAAVIASRVPDTRFILDHLLGSPALGPRTRLDPQRIGIMGHSFGGWTALAAAEADSRIAAVVALAPGGASRPRSGILPLRLDFAVDRDIPTLYLVAENDVSLPLAGMHEIFARAPSPKRMVILRRADHYHFMDNASEVHDTVRAMPAVGGLEWLREMLPFSELCPAEPAREFVRGLTLWHFDAALRQREAARRFWRSDVEGALAERGIGAVAPGSAHDMDTRNEPLARVSHDPR